LINLIINTCNETKKANIDNGIERGGEEEGREEEGIKRRKEEKKDG